jgi:hypothetical protein
MELLRTRPALRACVVDLPQVIAIAERRAASDCPAEIRERLSFVGGDMFEALPEGDAYLLSGILHDWDDASCSRILERCAARLPEGGRLVCLDCVLPPLGDVTGSALKLLDLQMMVGLPGKERTEPEWRVLCRSAGFEIERIVHPEPRNGPSLLEAVRT